ncbi:MAG TPA: hypothetical protein VLB76_09930 [Thermoanaerobaculia bacterium]|jgi:photosystem II stability/assembly factor-like uncharacterized protein|nr:hypothetical protein [Thermoanaerobaculia bacterium]
MRRSLICVALAALALHASAARAAETIDPDLLAGLEARSIGPATMSGRLPALDVAESNPDLMYAGGAAGGVWKTLNGGLTWAPVFDDQPVASIGAIAINQSNPDVVWVGTGEGNPRNSVSIGGGVFRTLDGGQTWSRLGLEKTEHIYRIVLHPADPNVAWVAALGQVWGENPERGVFKTVDGGKTWRRVLYVDPRTGAGDLVIDPSNPNKLFAAMWDYRRWPWGFRSGGPGSGFYVSYDGGETWKRYTEDDGIPKGDLGRIGIAISRSNPNIVYALIEAEKSALVRSSDGGRTWKKVNENQKTAERPFYYADIRVDPQWPNRLYSLTARLQVSEDSGASFETLGRSREVHGDYHAMWIDPRDPEHMVTGSDGGMAISHDRGETWQFVSTLPIGQFYHVAVDMDRPYHVYGGLQDNGSWRGPTSDWTRGGIPSSAWDVVGGGDGFDTRPDPEDSMTGYSMSQGGALQRWNLRTRENRFIKPPQPAGLKPLRFNWNAGLGQDPFEPGTIYYGSQYVHKSTDRGASWTVISPDLTTNNPEWQQQKKSGGLTLDISAAENLTTIIAIVPSAKQKGVIWVGTDDGRLHVTRDGGQTWTSVEKNVPGVPANTWIPNILPSKYDAASAFVVFDNHRRQDFTPYVFRTDDWGKTWKSLATRDLRGYALSVEQDPADRNLLFLGTEFGLYASVDGGAHWMPWTHGVPTTSVMALTIHPRDLDLVIGTHGRALYVLDDITPLREVSAATLAEPVHLYTSQPAMLYRVNRGRGGIRGGGAGEYQGQNREYGALIAFSVNAPGLPLADEEKERQRKEAARTGRPAASSSSQTNAQSATDRPTGTPREDIPSREESASEEEAGGGRRGGDRGPKAEIRITDPAGKVIRTLKPSIKLGLNRVAWDFSREPFRNPDNQDEDRRPGRDSGPNVIPGTYGVVVKYGGHEAKGTLRVEADPTLKSSPADWQAWDTAITRAGGYQNVVADAINRISATRKDVNLVLARLDAQDKERERNGAAKGGDDAGKALRQSARDLQKKLSAVERRLYVPPDTKGLVSDETTALSKVENARRVISSSWETPSATANAYLDETDRTVREVLADFNKLYAEDVPAFQRKLADAKIGLLSDQGPIEIK